MTTFKYFTLAIATVITASTLIGCVARDEFLRCDFSRRKALERAETLERDLADERNRALALETERESYHRELDAKTAESETLKAENAKLLAFADKMQGHMDDILKNGMNSIEVVEVKLPAELDKALKGFAARFPDVVQYDSQRGAVRWMSDLTFAKGSDEVRQTARTSLAEFARIVNSQAASQFEVVVVGHTDTLPISSPVTKRKHPTNWHLSVHRAIAVMMVLRRNNLDYERMGCMGYGEFHPRVPNPPRGGNEANRRVEIFLVGGRDSIGTMNTG
ncbi:MAG: OmpA family protein [Planctomycetota bacterium]|nr:OmpA family protein [Planctomycetota bacterium]MCZ6699507.1 OmpA family protein [Planctomycetota bacterium]